MNAISSSILVLAGALLVTGHSGEAAEFPYGAGLLIGLVGLIGWAVAYKKVFSKDQTVTVEGILSDHSAFIASAKIVEGVIVAKKRGWMTTQELEAEAEQKRKAAETPVEP